MTIFSVKDMKGHPRSETGRFMFHLAMHRVGHQADEMVLAGKRASVLPAHAGGDTAFGRTLVGRAGAAQYIRVAYLAAARKRRFTLYRWR